MASVDFNDSLSLGSGNDFGGFGAEDLYQPGVDLNVGGGDTDLSFTDFGGARFDDYESLFNGNGPLLEYGAPSFSFSDMFVPDESPFDVGDTCTLPLMAGTAAVVTADDWLGWEAGKALGDIGRSAWSTLEGWGSRAATSLGSFAEGLGPRLASGLLTAARFTPLGMMLFLEGDTPSGGDHFEQGPQIPPFTETLINQPGFHIGKEIFPARESHWSDGLLTGPAYDGPVLSDYSFPVHQSDWRESLTTFPADLLGHWSDSIYLADSASVIPRGVLPSYGEKEMADMARKFGKLTIDEQLWWLGTGYSGRKPEFLKDLHPPLISTSEIGDYVEEGGERTVFSLASDPRQVIGVFQDNSAIDWLNAYLGVEGLRTFEEASQRTVNPRYPAQVALHQGSSEGDFARYFEPSKDADLSRPFPAVIHDRYVLSSTDLFKQVVAIHDDAVGGRSYYFQVTDAALRVDERSLEDLLGFGDWLQRNPVWHVDQLQFGIFEDGSLAVTDTGYARPADRIEKFDLKILDFLGNVFRGKLKPGDLYGPVFYEPPPSR